MVYALIAYRRDFCTHRREEKCAGLVSLLGFSNAITHPVLCTAATSAAVCCIVKIKRFNVNPNTWWWRHVWVEWEQSFVRRYLLFSLSLWEFKQHQQTDIFLLWLIRCQEAAQRPHITFFTSFSAKQQKLASTGDGKWAGAHGCFCGNQTFLRCPSHWAFRLSFSLDLLSEINVP